MTITVRNFIDRALRKVNEIPIGTNAKGYEAAEALTHYNLFMHGLNAHDGVTFEFSDQVLTDTVPLDRHLHNSAIWAFVGELIGPFEQGSLPGRMEAMIDDGMRTLQAAFFDLQPMDLNNGLMSMSGDRN